MAQNFRNEKGQNFRNRHLINRKEEHEEITAQLNIATQQNHSLMNSERAWVTARLRWYEGGGRIVFLDSQVPGIGRTSRTASSFMLELTNDGKTPAWIETVSGSMEISGTDKQLELPISEYIEPIGAGKSREIQLTMFCDGQPRERGESLSVHITITYRDIFEPRKMALEYSVDASTYAIRRLEQVKLDFTSGRTA